MAIYGEQIIAGEVDHRVFVLEHIHPAGENLVNQPQDVLVLDGARQFGPQNGVIQCREMLHDIGPQHILIALRQPLQAVESAMGALADAIGVAIGDKTRIKDRLDDVA